MPLLSVLVGLFAFVDAKVPTELQAVKMADWMGVWLCNNGCCIAYPIIQIQIHIHI